MIETYFSHRPPIAVLRSGRSAPYIDGFASHLKEAGYPRFTGQRYLHAAAHLGYWPGAKRSAISSFNEKTIRSFSRHLRRCRCLGRDRGDCLDTIRAVRHFMEYLRGIGVLRHWRPPKEVARDLPPPVQGFAHWMIQDRGASRATVSGYLDEIRRLGAALGHDSRIYGARKLRRYFLSRCRGLGRAGQGRVGTAIRMYLRYLICQGKCRVGLEAAIPSVAQWRLASTPRYLPGKDIERVIRACDPRTRRGCRDRAAILLMARLALRAGDVTGLRLTDIDWQDGTIRVGGKSRRETRLPLPKEVGDALVRYLEFGRPSSDCNYLFLRMYAPRRPLSSPGITSIVVDAIRRAGVKSPVLGAHVLRHSAATTLLKKGASLQQIAVVFRHRSIETTARYAKVHVNMLRRVAQPWPESGPSC